MPQVTTLFTALLLVLQAPGQFTDLRINPNEIGPGDAATLTWKLKDGQSAYILGVGKVTGSGSLLVRPQQGTTYTLLTGDRSAITSNAVEIKVRNGRRGDDTCTLNQSAYKYPKSFTVTDSSTISFLNTLHHVLQDNMGFSLSEVQTPPMEPHFVFSTNCFIRSNLIFPDDEKAFPDDKRIGARRVAYQIEISESPNRAGPGQTPTLKYVVSTFIQYKKKIERTWRLDQNEAVYNKAVEMLQNEIRPIH